MKIPIIEFSDNMLNSDNLSSFSHISHKEKRKDVALSKQPICIHKDRISYAKGFCRNCYINEYNRQKRIVGLTSRDRKSDHPQIFE